MRKLYGVVAVVASTLMPLTETAKAQQWKNQRFDTVWTPLNSQELARQLKANKADAVALYQLWRRASYQEKDKEFFLQLEKLRKTQPKNGVLAAIRCAVIEESILHKGFPQFAIPQNEWAIADVRRDQLELAKKLTPNLWLNFITEAKLIVWEAGTGTDPALIKRQVQLCRKAVALSPQLSFTNKELAARLSALCRRTKRDDAEAVRYYKIAQQAKPRVFSPSLGLHYHYRYVKPNPAERKKAAQEVLATIAPGTKLTTPLRQLLTKQGITPAT